MFPSANMNYLDIPALTSSNFSNWLWRIEVCLDKESVKSVLETSPSEKAEEKADFESKDKKAQLIIIQGISDRHLKIVNGIKTAKDVVTTLRNVFARTNHSVQVESLLREFEAAEASLDEIDRACYLLLTMPESYNTVITALATMTIELTNEFIKGRFLDTGMRIKEGRASF
ncbi:hypothetical protein PR048_009298 [Dryococelus australis]|uniref:Copia protein n=1 Tax=Dryococelus australis TaxID=614101 RepID=A0ABQ9I0L3_9NEOP|nr:hypothetical protein PR048_009298 [Dryococelus australis]